MEDRICLLKANGWMQLLHGMADKLKANWLARYKKTTLLSCTTKYSEDLNSKLFVVRYSDGS